MYVYCTKQYIICLPNNIITNARDKHSNKKFYILCKTNAFHCNTVQAIRMHRETRELREDCDRDYSGGGVVWNND